MSEEAGTVWIGSVPSLLTTGEGRGYAHRRLTPPSIPGMRLNEFTSTIRSSHRLAAHREEVACFVRPDPLLDPRARAHIDRFGAFRAEVRFKGPQHDPNWTVHIG